ncbi:hypothetical protein C8R47DRAFT_1158671 [Mycena vitilis]|nr:hypothetical protein C8R47DRAFT_1167917 [Mycena vitilis]KAJ6462304.1 hypothetical protein C8R47DRAFT_1158671 [Mycena vitilis]
MTLPLVGPSDYIVKMFWRRVSHLTTRTHDENDNWIGGPEIRAWNRSNGTACSKCTNSKTKRICMIDENHTGCIPCRTMKIGCDRKLLFLFDLTRDEYFPTFDQFMKVIRNKPRTEPKRSRTSIVKLRRLEQERNDRRPNTEPRNPCVSELVSSGHPSRAAILSETGLPLSLKNVRHLRTDFEYVYDTIGHLESVLLAAQGNSSGNIHHQTAAVVQALSRAMKVCEAAVPEITKRRDDTR